LSSLSRAVVFLCSLATIAASLILWNATGRAVWTMYRDPARDERPGGESLEDLFEEAGVAPLETAPNEFRFGMLPSGVADRNIVSVATVAGPAALAALAAIFPSLACCRRHETCAQRDDPK
jgi:hypothetical protein